MELIPLETCVLCYESTAVLPSSIVTPYMKYINTTFFDKNKNGLDCFQEEVADKSFCVLCAHKILTSHKFKDTYKSICNKRTTFKKSKIVCFICESKSADLIQTDSNPNDFHVKIKTFMDSTLWSRPYLQCVVCFNCVFCLNIWFEMNLHVMEKIDGKSVVKTLENLSKSTNENGKNIQSPHENHTPNGNDGVLLNKGKENITPPESISQKQSNSENDFPRRTIPQKRKRNFRGKFTQKLGPNHCLNGSSINGNTKNMDSSTETSKELHSFLKQTLKNLKSVSETNISECPKNVLSDKKMFSSIPYVLMIKDDKPTTLKQTKTPKLRKLQLKSLNPPEEGSRKSSRLNKAIEVIDLLNSNSEADDNADELKNTANQSLKPNRSKLSLKRKPVIKIRLSSRFSINQNSAKYSCNICDQEFAVNCEYKTHSLWHEKPENLVINVTRHNLPEQTKASLFNTSQPTQKGKKKIPRADSEIDKLLQKYGTSPTDAFEDSDCNDSNEIANIIENLNSQDNEDSKDASGPEQNEGIEVEPTKNKKLKNVNDADEQRPKESDGNSSKIVKKLSSQEEEQSIDDTELDKNKEIIVDSHQEKELKNKKNINEQLPEDSDCDSTKDIEKSNSHKHKETKNTNEQLSGDSDCDSTNDIEKSNSHKHKETKNKKNENEQLSGDSDCGSTKDIEKSNSHKHKETKNTNEQLSGDSDCDSTKDIEISNSQETEQSEDEKESGKNKKSNVGEQQSGCEKSKDDTNLTDELNIEEKEQSQGKGKQQKNKEIIVEEHNKQEDAKNERSSEHQAASPNADSEMCIKRVDKSKESQTKTKEIEVEEESKNNVEQNVNADRNSTSEESCEGINQTEVEKLDADIQPTKETEQDSAESDEDVEDVVASVEAGLALIHGEEQLSESENSSDNETCILDADEKDNEEQQKYNKQPIKSEDCDSINDDDVSKDTIDNCSEKEENNDSCSEESNHLEDIKEENCSENCTENNIKKRKRVGSLVVVDNNQEESDEIVTPKAKKVRFAMDYQSPKSVNKDTVPDEASNEEQNDEDGSSSTEDMDLKVEVSSEVE